MNEPAPSGPSLDFWFEFGSTYSYLSVMRIEPAAAQLGVRVCWKPFLLGPIFKAFGWDTSPFVLQKAKGEYMWRDVERQCQAYALPWKKPSVFPRRTLLPMRVALWGAQEPWMAAFCRAMMTEAFACDADVDDERCVADVLRRLDLPPAEVIAAAQSDANKLRLREQTDKARSLGIFGAPTCIARGEMFWGDDRLDAALAWAAREH